MYDPLALEVLRVTQQRLREGAERTARRSSGRSRTKARSGAGAGRMSRRVSLPFGGSRHVACIDC